MYIDLDAYSGSKKSAISWLASRDRNDLVNNISRLAAYTHCPCIVIAFYAGEAFGWTPDLLKYIGTLKRFYGYTEILNKPEGCPI